MCSVGSLSVGYFNRLPPQREGLHLMLRWQAGTYLRTVTWRQVDSAKVLHDVAAHKPRDYGTILHNHQSFETDPQFRCPAGRWCRSALQIWCCRCASLRTHGVQNPRGVSITGRQVSTGTALHCSGRWVRSYSSRHMERGDDSPRGRTAPPGSRAHYCQCYPPATCTER